MALRPIDNALPTTTPERPKKQPKIAVATQKQQDRAAVVNGENQVPLPSSGDTTVDYVSSDNLKPLSDPEVQIQSLIEDLNSKNWTKVCESLNNARRFAVFHSPLLFPILGNIVLVVTKTMKNPRSALCKTAIMAAADIFNAFGDNFPQANKFGDFERGEVRVRIEKAERDWEKKEGGIERVEEGGREGGEGEGGDEKERHGHMGGRELGQRLKIAM
ncbi:TOG array regulator of axonemal microtubules protein 1-like [Vigna umbellata]|uniref:TOG array regulator of axonemal microtubules protein 1-like n=1 Tax=Vigna umbellata TaxID=87088 RepID=UPI001F5F7FBB|nr:TOG array regulator of axonemal microtubules protein 1-like [Vigna umbellata]